jgi:LAO/AO transport system kinase
MPDPSTLFESAGIGDRVALARLLSLVERGGDESRSVAGLAFKSPGEAYTVGITGAPGAGKSTLTDHLIATGRQRGLGTADHRAAGADGPVGGGQVAVLAIDPSSPFSGGAILGDRVRMQSHALDDGVFIRSMATRGHLGGLSVAVPDAVRLLSAVGVPIVFIETVGVGQQEVAVAAAADTTMVVVNPGWGDAVQANKAGLLEIGDLFVINKADRPDTRETRRDLELMLDLTELGPWRPPIVETVATTGDGIDQLWEAVRRHRRHLLDEGLLEEIRHRRLVRELHQIVGLHLEEQIGALMETEDGRRITGAVAAGDLDPYAGAERLLSSLLSIPDDGSVDL